MRLLKCLVPIFRQTTIIAAVSLICAAVGNGFFAGPRRHLAWRGAPLDVGDLSIARLVEVPEKSMPAVPLPAPPVQSPVDGLPALEASPLKKGQDAAEKGKTAPLGKATPGKGDASAVPVTPTSKTSASKTPISSAASPGTAAPLPVPSTPPPSTPPPPTPSHSGDSAIREISSQEAWAAYQAGTPFLDGRRSVQFESGHIKGAHCLPVWESDMESRIIQFEAIVNAEPNAPLVLYCSSKDCEDSHMLAAKLRRLGYRNLLLYKGGYPDWVALGRPVSQGAQP